MSHSVQVTLIADQEIEILGRQINIHDLNSIFLDSEGNIIEATYKTERIDSPRQ